MQIASAGTRRVAPDAVHRDADNLRAVLTKPGKYLLVKRPLITAHRTPVSGIEHEDNGAAAEIAETKERIGGGMQREIRRLHARGEDVGDAGGNGLGHCGSCRGV